MAKFFLKLLKYLLKFIDDLPIISAARKFAEKNLETTLLVIFIIFIRYCKNSIFIYIILLKKFCIAFVSAPIILLSGDKLVLPFLYKNKAGIPFTCLYLLK